MPAPPLLRASDLHAGYGDLDVLRGVGLEVAAGEVVAVLGANGAGKTTLLKCLSGVVEPRSGVVTLDGEDVTGRRPDQRLSLGLAHVPEGREVFASLSVEENLRLGAYTRSDASDVASDLEQQFERFGVLGERRNQAAGTLSGGEQQQLALARALMARPSVLLLDEPSLGLAPVLVTQVFDTIAAFREEGLTMVIVEQNTTQALRVSDRVYVMQTGRFVLDGPAEDVADDARLRDAYLGAAGPPTSDGASD